MERIIEETATVVAVEDGFAWVEADRRSACGHCGSADACGTGTLAKLFRQGRTRLRIHDPMGLRNGERVTIAVQGGTLLRASFTAYMLPLAALVAAAGLATAMQLTEGLVAIAGVAGLGAGLWLSGRLTGGIQGRDRYRPILIGRAGFSAPVPFKPSGATPGNP
ncbi:SoxR reducing system RseC family protein [Thiorhodococcus mannitoliphagus]|uniref:SoxR reducing system RseC family protein n=1 Tax=Thiorhodococcus mannitoliphagus TaxID=329406 RepID=A0A6P1DT22_9GAMM|nr:SoxR reducing system RseC family protein [Thiorhodococcus mannitoliphagus]NEX19836.1 SoxR reducing system RseC family protein [Thiorhodococcus mannitoliphagus]